MAPIDFTGIENILETAYQENRSTLLEYEVYEILRAGQIPAPKYVVIQSFAEIPEALKKLDTARVVVKIVAAEFQHKTDMGGIQFAARSVEAVHQACEVIWHAVQRAGVDPNSTRIMITEFVAYRGSFGRDLLFSFRLDPAFGPIINFGIGGVDTEFFGKHLKAGESLALRSTRDLSSDDILKMVEQTAIFPKLAGQARGQTQPLVDLNVVVRILKVLSEIAEYFSPLNPNTRFTINEFEINPMAVTDEAGLVALDGLAKFSIDKFQVVSRPVEKIKQLLEPTSALVVGASAKGMNPGRIILRNLLAGGGVPRDRIYLLHPKEEEIDGCPCFASLADLPHPVDMAVVTVPASAGTVDLIQEMIDTEKVASITLITSGFGETEAGKALAVKLEQVIKDGHQRQNGGTIVNGPNCLGIISGPGKYNTFFLPEYKLPAATGTISNIASVSQSGAYLVTQSSNIGHSVAPRYSISYGNQVDITVTDYLEYFAREKEVDVLSLYIEGLKPFDGRRFLAQARSVLDAGKAIILYKNGRTAAGAQAAASHTASIAGDFEVLRQLMKQAGVFLANSLDEFEDVTKTFGALAAKKVTGPQLGIITNAGFEATAASDAIGSLQLATFSPETVRTLEEKLPQGIIDFRNPVDTSPIADTNAFLTTVEAMLTDPQIECLVVSAVPVTPALNTLEASDKHREDIEHDNSFPKRLIRAFESTTKPVTVAIDSGSLYDPCARMLEEAGIPTFRRIDRAVKALSNFVMYHLDR